MYTTTELFGKIHTSKKPLAVARDGLRRQPLSQLEALCDRKFPGGWAALNPDKANSRERVYTPKTTGLAFLSQILSPGSSCREAVRQVQGAYALLPNAPMVSSDTSPYCQARARLELDRLVGVRRHLTGQMERNVPHGAVPWSRPIKVVDGTCFNLPDTPGNRALYPQSTDQKPGCGFPLVRMVGVFSLQTGANLEHAEAAYLTSEGALFRQLWSTFKPGDIVLADRLFDSFNNFAGLLQEGVDAIFSIHANRSHDFRSGRALGQHDRLYNLTKPAHPAAGWTAEEWAALPVTLTVRQLKAKIHNPNGRVKTITLITTLLDPILWPKELLLLIYRHRWNVELFLDDIKTTLQMDMLSCKTPAMVQKELEMHLVGYNLTRAIMQEAALTCHVPLARVSFKGALDTIRQFGQTLARVPMRQRKKRHDIYARMLETIATDLVPERPGRREPRCLKRRPKAYPFMTKPRSRMKDAPKSSRRKSKKHS
jgi:hypothetical protein